MKYLLNTMKALKIVKEDIYLYLEDNEIKLIVNKG